MTVGVIFKYDETVDRDVERAAGPAPQKGPPPQKDQEGPDMPQPAATQ